VNRTGGCRCVDQEIVESGFDNIDSSGIHAWIITLVGTMYNRAMQWKVYLSGEIHTDWRTRIAEGVRDRGLPVTLSAPVTDHAASDDCGVAILGEEAEGVWKDHKGAGVNAIRTRNQIGQADVVVVRFGDKYRQWNAAFDAGYAAAQGKTIITMHSPDLTHALKEVNRAALAVAETPEQDVEILAYISRA
jgi:YtoQ family protein